MKADRETAARLLAASVLTMFPGALLVQGEGTDQLFFYDFALASPFNSDMLPLIEERMRLMVKQSFEVRKLQMMPGNAAAQMTHLRQPWIASRLKAAHTATVQMIQIGPFVDWCEKEFSIEWDRALCFKLLEAYPIVIDERACTRIVGALCLDKEQLKNFVKQTHSFEAVSHLRLLEKHHLLAPALALGQGMWTWLPKGEKVRQQLVDWWKREHSKQTFHLISTPAQEVEEMTQAHLEVILNCSEHGSIQTAEMGQVKGALDALAEGLFQTAVWQTDRSYQLCKEEEVAKVCISSLQFIAKMPKILGFELQIVLYTRAQQARGKGFSFLQHALREGGFDYTTLKNADLKAQEVRICIRLRDSLGRWWDGPSLGIENGKGVKPGWSLIVRSTFGSLERFVALLLEQTKGELQDLLNRLMN